MPGGAWHPAPLAGGAWHPVPLAAGARHPLPDRAERCGGAPVPCAVDECRRGQRLLAELVDVQQLERSSRFDHERLPLVVSQKDLAVTWTGDAEKPSRTAVPRRSW